MRAAAVLAALLLLAALAGGCASAMEFTTRVGEAAGVISTQQAESLNRSAAAVEKTFQDITPEQEHYIGRAVAATVMASYQPLEAEPANHYLNVLGQTLALYSGRPETFGGYHFMILDSDEVNAFAAPGGLILVSRGLIRCCATEDMLAAVVAHEIGHVELRHGLAAIRKGRLNSALTVLALEAGKNLAGDQLAQVTEAFEGSISDITTTLMNNGYSRRLEYEADAAAGRILSAAGYDPAALVHMLERMQDRLASDHRGFGKTHPAPADRIRSAGVVAGNRTPAAVAGRQKRFEAAVAGI